MLEVMFELPSRDDIAKCIITPESITKGESPKIILSDGTTETVEKKTSA